jgi:hypothetical protein
VQQDDRNWFIGERSEALTAVLLTSRPELTVRTEKRQDDGVDFFVGLKEGDDVPTTKHLVVQVKGTLSPDTREWSERVSQLYKKAKSMFLPACVFIVNVRTNTLHYAWLAKPVIEAGSATLKFFDHPDFQSLDDAAIDEIITEVRAWYDAMPREVASQH